MALKHCFAYIALVFSNFLKFSINSKTKLKTLSLGFNSLHSLLPNYPPQVVRVRKYSKWRKKDVTIKVERGSCTQLSPKTLSPFDYNFLVLYCCILNSPFFIPFILPLSILPFFLLFFSPSCLYFPSSFYSYWLSTLWKSLEEHSERDRRIN